VGGHDEEHKEGNVWREKMEGITLEIGKRK
jgi:hypothetical protein